VHEIQIDVVELQPLSRPFERGRGLLVAGVGDPELRGDEDLVAGDAALPDGVPDRGFAAVGRGGVDQPIADVQRFGDASLALIQVGDLVHAEAERRHLDAVVQRHRRNAGHSDPSFAPRSGRPRWERAEGSSTHPAVDITVQTDACPANGRRSIADALRLPIGGSSSCAAERWVAAPNVG
jgi:hypothetical protein